MLIERSRTARTDLVTAVSALSRAFRTLSRAFRTLSRTAFRSWAVAGRNPFVTPPTMLMLPPETPGNVRVTPLIVTVVWDRVSPFTELLVEKTETLSACASVAKQVAAKAKPVLRISKIHMMRHPNIDK
jgi:hypothetical protein